MKRLLYALLIIFVTGCTPFGSGAPSAEAAISTGVGELARHQSLQIITMPQTRRTLSLGTTEVALVTFDAL